MDKFTTHTGVAAPLRYGNIDTDQIIPAEYLKRVSRSGFEDGLFAAWRTQPDFVLNQPAYASATVLVAGPDFGTGSSREHAVWALQNYGFKVVLSPRFGDIFRNNSGKSGLLAAEIDEGLATQLWDLIEAHPGSEVTVDLVDRSVTAEAAGRRVAGRFAIDDYTRWRLLEGLDDIAITLSHESHIRTYEGSRPAFKPVTH